MADTSTAIRAAREVQADTLAPELFRIANEWFFRAKNQYKFKNFKLAKEYAEKARRYAEEAEFVAIQAGASRVDLSYSDSQATEPKSYDYPSPTGRLAEKFENDFSSPSPTASPSPVVSTSPDGDSK